MTSRYSLVTASVLTAFGLILGGWVSGCGPTVPPYDRAALLTEVANDVIVPGYQDVQTQSGMLNDATTALCATPSTDSLGTARNAWRETFLAWQRTLAYVFGPAEDMNLGPEMAYWPTDPSGIEGQIGGTTEITADFIDSLGAGSKGLYAIEYLLFADADDATVTALMDTRRCAYLSALADHVQRTSTTLFDAWSPTGGDYAGTLATAGADGNITYPAELSAVAAVLNEIPQAIDEVKAMKLGKPIGHLAAAMPDMVESPYAHASVEAMQANMEGIRTLWTGTTHDFDDYLRTRNPDLADMVLAQLDAADAALAAVPEPLSDYAAGSDHSAGDAAYEALGTLERTIAADVSTSLAVSISIPNDGD